MTLLSLLLELVAPYKSVHYAIGPLAIAGLGMGYNVVSGLIRKSQADRAISELEKNKPKNYEITPELQRAYDDALYNKNKGFSQSERANFQQDLARQNAASYNKAMAYGGNTLAGAVRAGIGAGNVMALNRFAANDAAIRRQNILHSDAMAGQMTNQRNMATTRNLQDYDRQMAAYGRSSQEARSTIDNSVNLFASLAAQSAASSGGEGGWVGGGSMSNVPPPNVPVAESASPWASKAMSRIPGYSLGSSMGSPGYAYSGPPMQNYGASDQYGSGIDYSNPYGAQRNELDYSLLNNGYPAAKRSLGAPYAY